MDPHLLLTQFNPFKFSRLMIRIGYLGNFDFSCQKSRKVEFAWNIKFSFLIGINRPRCQPSVITCVGCVKITILVLRQNGSDNESRGTVEIGVGKF